MRRIRVVGTAIGIALVSGACAAVPGPIVSGGQPGLETPSPRGSITLSVPNTDRCDPIDPRHCMLPFPSDFFTTPDTTTDTGRRIAFSPLSTPTNSQGVHVDPTEWNRNDGFSPGQQISVFINGIDLTRSEINDVTDIGRSMRPNAPVVLIDATTGKRWPYFAELDASVTDPNDRVLYIRPAVNYPDGHRMVVAIRRARTASGAIIAANDGFRAYRDQLSTNDPFVEAQRARYERVFGDIAKAGVARDDTLYAAWDFTVASTRNLTERMLHIRDVTFAGMPHGTATSFTVDTVVNDPDPQTARRVTGTFDVPLFMDNDGAPGSRFSYGSNGLPTRTGTYKAGFICNIPVAAMSTPARGSIYGHGLLGSNREVSAGNVRAMGAEHNIVFCATSWIGLSEQDIGSAITTLGDISNMAGNVDRMQQGMLNALVLARLLKSPQGFVIDAAFQNAKGAPVVASGNVYYDGNSQGGIMGGALTAVSTDFTRAVLGVTGMNYSLLLQRSVDWDLYRSVYDPAYPTVIERGIGLSLLQMLWDRGEANGYANHMTRNPLPGTPAHRVLLEIAVGDFQVSNWAALVEARTIGARMLCPATTPGRLPGRDPFWGVKCMSKTPTADSSIVFWDSGTPAPPRDNVAPRVGVDSHEDPRAVATNREQKSQFLQPDAISRVIDVCNAQPCTAPSVG